MDERLITDSSRKHCRGGGFAPYARRAPSATYANYIGYVMPIGFEDFPPAEALRHVRGVQNMVDEDRYCIDVLTQISAIQAALDKVALGLLDDLARDCVIDGSADLKDERTQELTAAVARLLRRG
jgi:CsoR family transcriptional regulator, copper-sensing transcriptional repressor